MRRLIFISFFLVVPIFSFSQKKYVCEFADTTTTILPDSILRQVSVSSFQNDMPLTPELFEQLLAQMKQLKMAMYQLRIVKANNDRTVISIDRRSRHGNLSIETFDSLLYRNDEIFMDSSSITGFAKHPIDRPRKEFISTGKKIHILTYQCDEYVSTDTTCYIWVTTELPDYINPGIRKGNLKGAVLGFELKGEVNITKCVLSKFGIGL